MSLESIILPGSYRERSWKIDIIALFLIVAFTGLWGIQALSLNDIYMLRAILIAGGLALSGILLSLLIGIPSVTMSIDYNGVAYGLGGFAAIALVKVVTIGFKLSSLPVFYAMMAVFEELFFRFALYRLLLKVTDCNVPLAAICDAALFMIYHYMVYPASDIAVNIFVFASGIILCIIYTLSRSLSAPLIAHILNNIL